MTPKLLVASIVAAGLVSTTAIAAPKKMSTANERAATRTLNETQLASLDAGATTRPMAGQTVAPTGNTTGMAGAPGTAADRMAMPNTRQSMATPEGARTPGTMDQGAMNQGTMTPGTMTPGTNTPEGMANRGSATDPAGAVRNGTTPGDMPGSTRPADSAATPATGATPPQR